MHRRLRRGIACAALAGAGTVAATPSTTYWAPSTTYVQPFLVPHLDYDTYFWRGASAGQAGSPAYPVIFGATMGVLPFRAVALEVGLDLLLPSSDRLLLNAKLGHAQVDVGRRDPREEPGAPLPATARPPQDARPRAVVRPRRDVAASGRILLLH